VVSAMYMLLKQEVKRSDTRMISSPLAHGSLSYATLPPSCLESWQPLLPDMRNSV
jgi:hypothetical protein